MFTMCTKRSSKEIEFPKGCFDVRKLKVDNFRQDLTVLYYIIYYVTVVVVRKGNTIQSHVVQQNKKGKSNMYKK